MIAAPFASVTQVSGHVGGVTVVAFRADLSAEMDVIALLGGEVAVKDEDMVHVVFDDQDGVAVLVGIVAGDGGIFAHG